MLCSADETGIIALWSTKEAKEGNYTKVTEFKGTGYTINHDSHSFFHCVALNLCVCLLSQRGVLVFFLFERLVLMG